MYHITGVEITEALSNIYELETSVSADISSKQYESVYKSNLIHTSTLPNIFQEVSTGHPIRNKLEPRRKGDTQEGHNIWVYKPLPHHSLLTKGLQFL